MYSLVIRMFCPFFGQNTRIFLLAVVTCKLLPHLQSARFKHHIAHGVLSSGRSEESENAGVLPDDSLLKCDDLATKMRFVIRGKDAPFWRYAFAELDRVTDDFELSPVDCETYTPPSKILHTLDNTSRSILSSIAGVEIVSFSDEVHCSPCVVVAFNATCLKKCAAPHTGRQFMKVHKTVTKAGGSCAIEQISKKKRTLQACMASPQADEYATCKVRN